MTFPRMIPETVALDDATANAVATAKNAIDQLSAVQNRLGSGGHLWIHLEWAKEALWAAAYPGSVDDSILNALEAAADQVG